MNLLAACQDEVTWLPGFDKATREFFYAFLSIGPGQAVGRCSYSRPLIRHLLPCDQPQLPRNSLPFPGAIYMASHPQLAAAGLDHRSR